MCQNWNIIGMTSNLLDFNKRHGENLYDSSALPIAFDIPFNLPCTKCLKFLLMFVNNLHLLFKIKLRLSILVCLSVSNGLDSTTKKCTGCPIYKK